MNSLLQLEYKQVTEGVEGYSMLNEKLTEEITEIKQKDVHISIECEEIESEIESILKTIKDVSIIHSQ